MSQFGINFRKTLDVLDHRGNIAVFEYVDNNGNLVKKAFTTLENNTMHTEKMAKIFLETENIPLKNVKRIFSELEPCVLPKHMCKALINNNFSNAKTTFSYYYGSNPIVRELARELRAIDYRA